MGSIPLAANNLKVPEQPNALDQYARIMNMQHQQALMPGQIQAQQQQLQMGQVELQKAKQQQADTAAHTAAMKAWNVKSDPNGETLPQLILDNGGSGDAASNLRKSILAQKEQISITAKNDAETGAKKLDILKQKNDVALGAIKTVDNIPDGQLADHLDQTLQSLTQQGTIDQQHAQQGAQLVQGLRGGQLTPQQARDQLTIYEKSLQSNTQQIDQAAKAAEAAKNTAQGNKDQAEADIIKKYGGVSVDHQELADYLAKNPGKGPIDFAKTKAGFSAQAGASAQAGLLSDAAKQMAAQNYTQTGALPTGLRSPAMSAQVLNQAASGPNGIPNIAVNKMAYGADKTSLAALQKNFDQVTAFENTAGKNLDVFLNQAQKVVDSGNPMINRPLRTIVGSMGGTDQAAFDTARTTALTEIAKVLNSSNASGVLSDSARHEVEGLIRPNATLAQIFSAAKILKTDMGNRHDSYQQQIDAIKARGNSQAAPAQQSTSGGMIQARDPQGKLHQAPAGTALPAGWKLEQ